MPGSWEIKVEINQNIAIWTADRCSDNRIKLANWNWKSHTGFQYQCEQYANTIKGLFVIL